MQAGDIVLVAGRGPLSACIRWGQRFLRPSLAAYSGWTHVAVAVSDTDLVEARFKGVHRVPLAAMHERYQVVDTKLSAEDRQEAAAFALSCVGEEYGVLQIISIALSLISAGHIGFSTRNHRICSQLGAEALERGTYIFDRDPSQVCPADIGHLLGAPA